MINIIIFKYKSHNIKITGMVVGILIYYTMEPIKKMYSIKYYFQCRYVILGRPNTSIIKYKAIV